MKTEGKVGKEDECEGVVSCVHFLYFYKLD